MSKSFKRNRKPGEFSDHKIKAQKKIVAAKHDRFVDEYEDDRIVNEYMSSTVLNKISKEF